MIGDNAFIGVSHLSQSHARDTLWKLDEEVIVDVIRNAISSGASGFAFSTQATNIKILRSLESLRTVRQDFELWPLLPYAEGYVRLANEKGMIGLVREVMSRLPLSGKVRSLAKGAMSAMKLDPIHMLGAYVDMELESYLNVKPESLKLGAVMLHEVVTDLGISLQATRLFDSFIQHIRDNYACRPGFVTRNFARFVKFFRDERLSLKDVVIMTPFNKIGFQMNPSRESCEDALGHLKEGDVVAMSIMAGGYLGLDESIEYLKGLMNVSGVVVGVSSAEHAIQTFSRLGTLITR